ncbi:MAG: hypothetical protein Q9213_003736 [Squamulea squamosa]
MGKRTLFRSATEEANPVFDQPLPAPMPFAESLRGQPTVTVTHFVSNTRPTVQPTLSRSSATLMSFASYESTESATQSILSSMSPSADPMMQGNPEPKHPKLHAIVVVGIALVSMLAFSIIPLLIFHLVIRMKLNKAIRQRLAQGRRRRAGMDFNDPEQTRRELAVEAILA